MEESINDFALPAALRDPSDPWWRDVKASDEFLDRVFKSFYKKIGLATTLLLLVLSAVRLRYADPGLLAGGGARKWVYLGLVLTMLPVVALLGHYGAKLAYQWKKKEL